MVRADRPWFTASWIVEAEDGQDFKNTNRQDNRTPECLQWSLLERQVRWLIDIASKEWMELLSHKEAQRSKHTHAAVFQLHFTVEPDLFAPVPFACPSPHPQPGQWQQQFRAAAQRLVHERVQHGAATAIS